MSPKGSKPTAGKKPPAKKAAPRKRAAPKKKPAAKKPPAKKAAPRKRAAAKPKPPPATKPAPKHGAIRKALEHTLEHELESMPVEAVTGFLREIADELDAQRAGDGQLSASLANVYDSRLAELPTLDEDADDPFNKHR